MDDDLMVTMNDVRAAGMCSRGSKNWFEGYGIDFRTFLRDGMLVRDMEALNDALGNRVARFVRENAKDKK